MKLSEGPATRRIPAGGPAPVAGRGMKSHKITHRGQTYVLAVRPPSYPHQAVLLGTYGVIRDTGCPEANRLLAEWLVRTTAERSSGATV